jgi:hypothetical protein
LQNVADTGRAMYVAYNTCIGGQYSGIDNDGNIDSLVIANNTIYGSTTRGGIAINGSASDSIWIENNVIYNTDTYGVYIANFNSNCTIRNNTIVKTGAASLDNDDATGVHWIGNIYEEDTEGTLTTNAYNMQYPDEDPFVDYTNNDYSLAADTFYVIDLVEAGGTTTDILGNSITGAYRDAGAYEYQSPQAGEGYLPYYKGRRKLYYKGREATLW